jgi:hypothetical protein
MGHGSESRVIRSALVSIFLFMGLSFLCAYLDGTGRTNWKLAEALSPMFVALILLFSSPQWSPAV